MVCRHIKINETYNFILNVETIEKVKVEYSKISNNSTQFILLDGDVGKIDNRLYLKQISFAEAGEYMVRVTVGDEIEYERYKVYNFSEEDNQNMLINILLSVENNNSELNEELLFIRRQLKLINAQL